jgi:acyl-coenzyme A thioesterase PaaI-like protein
LTQAATPKAPLDRPPKARRTIMDRLDTFVSRLSTRNNFWHRVCSLIWLPYAFKSGIRMKRIDASTFSAVLPFRRFNRNWYNAMAGAALLANSEVAGGMYVFGVCGGEYTVVCKELQYRFLRPCFGPAIYRISPREDLKALAAAHEEFNTTLDLEIVQQIGGRGDKERRVGRCTATFHVTPKQHQKKKGRSIRG